GPRPLARRALNQRSAGGQLLQPSEVYSSTRAAVADPLVAEQPPAWACAPPAVSNATAAAAIGRDIPNSSMRSVLRITDRRGYWMMEEARWRMGRPGNPRPESGCGLDTGFHRYDDGAAERGKWRLSRV